MIRGEVGIGLGVVFVSGGRLYASELAGNALVIILRINVAPT